MIPSRKVGSTGAPGIGPRTSLVKPAAVSAAYGEALKVLSSDETMSQACELLLSERDYGKNTATEEKSDREKLLQLYNKCHEAAKVIEREAPVELPALPNAPPARAAVARAQAKPLGKPTATISVMPKRRMARLPAPPPKGKRLKREESDSSSTKERTSIKKSRLVPPQSKSPPPPAIDVNVSEPPASALHFLKKLNRPTEKKSPRKQKLEEKDEEEPDAEEPSDPTTTKTTTTRKQPTRTQPKRTQPSTASRK